MGSTNVSKASCQLAIRLLNKEPGVEIQTDKEMTCRPFIDNTPVLIGDTMYPVPSVKMDSPEEVSEDKRTVSKHSYLFYPANETQTKSTFQEEVQTCDINYNPNDGSYFRTSCAQPKIISSGTLSPDKVEFVREFLLLEQSSQESDE